MRTIPLSRMTRFGFTKKISLFSAMALAMGGVTLSLPPVAMMQQGSSSAVAFGSTQCSDGIDNDGDTFIDYLGDPDCESPADNDESGGTAASSSAATGSYECSDGIDNDGDGGIDQADFSCSSPVDDDESSPSAACNDGRDNDGDGLQDRLDPGCFGPQDNDESDAGTALMSASSSSSSAQTASQPSGLIMPPAVTSAASSIAEIFIPAQSSVPHSSAAQASSKATSVRGYSATETQPPTETAAPVILAASTQAKEYPGTVTIRIDPDRREARAGDTLGFTVTVANHSDVIAGGLTIEVAFDAADFEVTTADKAILENGELRWVNGGLVPDDVKKLRFVTKLKSDLAHGHVIRVQASLDGQVLSGPATSSAEVGIVGKLPATGSMRLKPLY